MSGKTLGCPLDAFWKATRTALLAGWGLAKKSLRVAEDFFQALVRDPVESVGVVRVLFYVAVVQQVAHGFGVLHTVGSIPANPATLRGSTSRVGSSRSCSLVACSSPTKVASVMGVLYIMILVRPAG